MSGSARLEGGKGLATIRLSSAASDFDTISKIREGVIKNISVGYLIHNFVRTDNKDGGPDIVEIRDWEPIEISAVAVPADAQAQIRSANGRRPKRRSRAADAADYTRRLLSQSRQSSAESHGASEARRLLSGVKANTTRVERAKPGALDKFDIAAGAHEARKLLRGRQ